MYYTVYSLSSVLPITINCCCMYISVASTLKNIHYSVISTYFFFTVLFTSFQKKKKIATVE